MKKKSTSQGQYLVQCTLVIVNAWIVNNLSLVNIFGETGRFFYNINYTMDRQWRPRERPLGKTPEVGLEGSEGSFQVKDALERLLRPL